MTEDEFRWAEALALRKAHGDGAFSFVVKRIGELASEGDQLGVRRMMQIAVKLEELSAAESGLRQ